MGHNIDQLTPDLICVGVLELRLKLSVCDDLCVCVRSFRTLCGDDTPMVRRAAAGKLGVSLVCVCVCDVEVGLYMCMIVSVWVHCICTV